MKLAFVCQAVDEEDPGLAASVDWIEEFAKHVQHLSVLSLRRGRHRLQPGISVCSFRRRWRLATLFQFYKEVLRLLRSGVTRFFVFQGGPYPLLLAPFKLTGIQIFQWKAHPHISWTTRFGARICADRIFTATPNSFPMRLKHLRVLGHGVNLKRFSISHGEKTGELVTVSRISPRKRIDLMLRVLAECNRKYGRRRVLDIYGPAPNRAYLHWLEARSRALGISDCVAFKDAVHHQQLPFVLSRYRLFLNFSATALDKAVIEAMACGLMLLSCNPCVAEVLRPPYRELLIDEPQNVSSLAKKLHTLLSWSEERQRECGRELREIAETEHNLPLLAKRIIEEIQAAN